ncbi:MAG: hypothetical protein SFU57_10345 [Gemmatimonadales bacterium]|nr:hypothetical protein [Gemmatimonadales bacterium]
MLPQSGSWARTLAIGLAVAGLSPSGLSGQSSDDGRQSRLVNLWLRASSSSVVADSVELPARIAEEFGLRFEAPPTRPNLGLDTALIRAVRSRGALRDSPWGWFALARQMQIAHGSCAPIAALESRQWSGHCRRVVAAYRDALKRDSLFVPVLADLDLLLPWPALWANPPAEERQILAAALEGIQIPPPLRSRLARRALLLEVHTGDLTTARHALQLADEQVITRGERFFLAGWLSTKSGDGVTAVRLWQSAADDDGPGDQLAWLGAQLTLIGTASEALAWDSLPRADRARWLGHFWEDRDLLDGAARGERITVHIARWERAFRDYRFLFEDLRRDGIFMRSVALQGCAVEPDADPFALNADPFALNADPVGLDTAAAAPYYPDCHLTQSFERGRIFDDRGLAYLRHGEPQQRVNYPGWGYFFSESWAYQSAEGLLAIHFLHPTPNPLDKIGMVAVPVPRGDLITACQVTPRYCVLAARQTLGERIPPERMQQVRERGLEEMRQLLATDGAPQRFRDPLPFNAGAYGLGSLPGRMTLAVDLPIVALRRLATGDSTRAVLRWQVRIRGEDGFWAVSSDSLSAIELPAQGPKGDQDDKERFATVTREYPLPPGRYDLRLVLSDSAGRTGAMFTRDGMAILPAAPSPGLSDLILLADGPHGASRIIEGEEVRLAPTFAAGKAPAVQLGYVLQGLAGREVRVSVEVRKVGKKSDRPAIAVSTIERPAADRWYRSQRLVIGRLGDGAYDVTISVPLPDGTIATRTQRMLVR